MKNAPIRVFEHRYVSKIIIRRIWRRLASWLAFAISFLCLAFFSLIAVLGLPESKETELHYADRGCRIAQVSFDRHLPCLDELSSRRPMDRQALWSVVRTACLPASYFGLVFPCTSVNREAGYVVIKSPAKEETRYIVVPTVQLPGIESLVNGDERRLWRAAWGERYLLEQASIRKLNWNDIVLAVNSKTTRSQDQLHIHLGCINSSLRDFLATDPLSAANSWQLKRPISTATSFFVKLLPEQAMSTDLIKMVYEEIPDSKIFADRQTIAIAGVTRGQWRGFALIVTLEATPAETFFELKC